MDASDPTMPADAGPVEAVEFRELVLAELDSVHRLAYHLALSRDLAEDLVQETYLRALKARARFRRTELGPRPWLFKILHNVYKSRLGKKYREPDASDDLDGRFAAPPDAPPVDLDWEQVDERLKRAVESLPPTHRSVLLMWAVEGLKYREIAEITDVPIGTVMSRLYRARQAIVEQTTELANEQRLVGRPGPSGTRPVTPIVEPRE